MAFPPDSPKHPAEEATVELQIPEPHDVRIGRYKLIRKIGAGGMGEIFLGEDERLNRKVALKLLPAEFTRDADRVRRFELEAKAASALNHPNIITIYEIGEADGVHYIVTEYIQGQTLRQQMAERLTIGTALDVATQMANALKAAHDVGIVHRDIKPENVMVRPDGLVKVLDFGIAKLVERPSAPQGDPYATTPEEALNETAPGIIMGTVSYMSPEQLRGQKVDARADIFSMGVVLYEVITGRTPFAGRTQVDRIAAILEADPAPLADHRPETPRDLERIVSKALRKDRDARYQLVEDLLGDLKELKQELEFQAKLRRSSPDMYITAADLGDDLRRVPATETDPTADTPSAAAPTFSGSNTATPPSGQRTDREAERRQLTVLVCGSEMFESEPYLGLDTEDQIRVLRAFEEACEEPVLRFGGTVVKCNEKGLLACFGFPVAYENAARRAARTGQAILDVMETLGEQLRREDKLELNPWVGIHTGPAVVELKAGVVSLAGEARNVAVRLEEVAVAGQVICTETSYRVFQGRFRCATLGPQKIRGISQPLEMFRVERIEAPGSLLEAVAPAELSPLTGRDQEVGLLKDRWEQAQEGMGQVVLLIGEPGLGKSRLVHTLKEHVLGQMEEGEVDAPVIEWRCSPQFQNTRLYPAIDYIERALSFDREEPAEDRFDRLLHRLEQYDLVRPETAPAVGVAAVAADSGPLSPAFALAGAREGGDISAPA
jgi:serine/threonine protein kinase